MVRGPALAGPERAQRAALNRLLGSGAEPDANNEYRTVANPAVPGKQRIGSAGNSLKRPVRPDTALMIELDA